MLYRRIFKPVADWVLAAITLVILLPVMCTLAMAIRLRMGSPVVFRQIRIGLNDQPFGFLKFRTMTQQRDGEGRLLPDEQRLTAFGRLLRSSSLDEFPQLWNVLRGEMSLIGPRPLLPEYVPRYSPVQRRRHEVKPGITGWAQVKGRNSISWQQKFQLDVWYVDHCSLALDLSILLMTFAAVVARKGISRDGHATAPPFLGDPP